MKIILASYFQPEYHGTGRKIGISVGKKPHNVECDFVFPQFAPEPESYWAYHQNKHTDPDAGVKFVEAYEARLEAFCAEVEADAKEENKTPIEILPFRNQDSLLSWEKQGSLTYRTHLAKYLERLGYEVEEN